MKNKVINLFDKTNIVVENKGVKYSELLEKFLEPFIKEFEDVEYYEEIFEFAINAWNFANMAVLLPDDEGNKAMNSIPGDEIDFVLLNKMVDYKILKFKEYTNFIVDYELKEQTSGDPILSVTTQPEEQYLAEMINKMDEEADENDSDENDFEEGFIDRTAIIIKPRQPFLDWCSNLFPEEEDFNNTNTYLINEDIEDIDSWLKRGYENIFTIELEAWTHIKKQWPQKRNYKMFKEWFSIDQSTMVYDLEINPISKF